MTSNTTLGYTYSIIKAKHERKNTMDIISVQQKKYWVSEACRFLIKSFPDRAQEFCYSSPIKIIEFIDLEYPGGRRKFFNDNWL